MVQRYNILGRYTNQCLCLCSHAWPVEVSHGKIRVRQTGTTPFIIGQIPDAFTQNGIDYRPYFILIAPDGIKVNHSILFAVLR